MKYVIVIGDGMADRPLKELGGKTLLEACHIPNLNQLAKEGCGGLVKTVPDECDPGSDVANLSILGYDPRKYYTGRAPLEAVSMGIKLNPEDVAFRCNLVTVTEDILLDYCAGHITTEEAKEAISCLEKKMGNDSIAFIPGVSYRHLMVYRNAPQGWREGKLKTTPPHDFTGKGFDDFLPRGEEREIVTDLMKRSRQVLEDCPINQKRLARNLSPANMIWLWGQGGAVILPSITAKWKIQGAVISAVDLVRGIGRCAGLDIEIVEGATGFIDTNYQGKVDRALQVLEKKDFVFVHVEAPDEAGHSGKWQVKKQAIEDFDARVIGPLVKGLKKFKKFRMLIMPDHATPIELKTHSREPVPFLIYPALKKQLNPMTGFNEVQAKKGFHQIENGHELLTLFMEGEKR